MSVSSQCIKQIYRPRPAWSHKGEHGRLLVVGGSVMYTGSPIFNALAAYRAGCDIVKICAPEKAAFSIRAYLPDMVAYPLKGDYLSRKHARFIIGLQKSSDAMVIGGGLGRNASVIRAVGGVIKKTSIPAVVDADALYAVNFVLNKNFILTPHAREFEKLSGKPVGDDITDRIDKTKALASCFDCIVMLKGHVDIITDGIKTEMNKRGCPEMAKAGTGDVLAGICGALLARGTAPFEAACAAAWINGRAGELAAKKLGEGMKASDVLDMIPNAIRYCKQ